MTASRFFFGCLFCFWLKQLSSSSSSSSFLCVHHSPTRCVKTALPLSLSLSSLKKSQEGTRKNSTRDLDFTQEELITHHKKKNRTERSLFTLSLSLSFFFQKHNKLFSSVVFAKTSRRSSFLLLYLSSVLLFNTSSLVF